MAGFAETILKTLESKEYLAVQKCFKQKCPKLIKLQERETALIKEIQECIKEIDTLKKTRNEENAKKVFIIIKKMFKLVREQVKISSNKEVLSCKMKDCTDEFSKLSIKTSNDALKQLDNTEKFISMMEGQMLKKK
jgi:hypothetical protein